MRKSVAFVVSLYAIAFAFLAMTAVRWPTLMQGVALGFGEAGADLAGFDWRALGLHYGVPFLAAAVAFQTASMCLAMKKHFAFSAFVIGLAIAAPTSFVFADAQAHMTLTGSLTTAQWAAIWMIAISLLLTGAVWDLRKRPPKLEAQSGHIPPQVIAAGLAIPMTAKQARKQQRDTAKAEKKQAEARAKARRPVPLAIARQRQMFAEQGRRDAAKQARRRAQTDQFRR